MSRGQPTVDHTGKRFGRLTVISWSPKTQQSGIKASKWLCKCDCGKTISVFTSNLNKGTRSCGCSPKGLGGNIAIKRSILREYKFSARIRNLEFSIKEEDFYDLISTYCYYCGIEPSTVRRGALGTSLSYNGIDRKNNQVGYVDGNIVACCRLCNRAKGAKTFEEFTAWINRIGEFYHRDAIERKCLYESTVSNCDEESKCAF